MEEKSKTGRLRNLVSERVNPETGEEEIQIEFEEILDEEVEAEEEDDF